MVLRTNYWEERLIENQFKLGTKKMDKEILKIYKLASKELQALVNDLWLKMLQNGSISQWQLYQYGRYIVMQEQINKILTSLGQQEISIINTQLQALYETTFTESARYLGGEVLSGSFSLLNPQTAYEVANANFKGATFSDRIWKRQDLLKEQLTRVITNSAILGKDWKSVSRDLASRLEVGLSDSKRLVRTETIRVLNSAALNKAIERGYSTYHVLMETDACDECKAEYEGKNFKLGDGNAPPLHPHCRCCVIIDIPQENTNTSSDSSDIMNTGALNEYSDRANEHAQRYYESVRHMTSDVDKISAATGWKKEAIEKIKEHVFIKEHDLGNGYPERFAPSYHMSQSWQRLISGKFKEQDIVLLKHEYLELALMKKGHTQYEAHIAASKKHNYANYTRKGE